MDVSVAMRVIESNEKLAKGVMSSIMHNGNKKIKLQSQVQRSGLARISRTHHDRSSHVESKRRPKKMSDTPKLSFITTR